MGTEKERAKKFTMPNSGMKSQQFKTSKPHTPKMSQSIKVRAAPQSVSLPTKSMSSQHAKKEMDMLRKRFNDELL